MAGVTSISSFTCQQWTDTSKINASLQLYFDFDFHHQVMPGSFFLSKSELVAMMLRWLPEDITVHNEDLEG